MPLKVDVVGGEVRECMITVDGMTCQSCVNLIKDTVPRKLTNVSTTDVSIIVN